MTIDPRYHDRYVAVVDGFVAAACKARADTGVAWCELDLGDVHIVAVWPDATDPAAPAEALDPLPWDHYAETLRDDLKRLSTIYPASAIAGASARLAELVAVYGPVRGAAVQ